MTNTSYKCTNTNGPSPHLCTPPTVQMLIQIQKVQIQMHKYKYIINDKYQLQTYKYKCALTSFLHNRYIKFHSTNANTNTKYKN